MEQVEDLIEAISEFRKASPEDRRFYLASILTHGETQLISPALSFLIPYLSEEEMKTVENKMGEGVFSADFKPTEKFISSLLVSALSSQDPKTRDRAASISIEFESKLDWKVKKDFLFLLASPDEETRDACANLLSEFKGEDTRLFGHFVNLL